MPLLRVLSTPAAACRYLYTLVVHDAEKADKLKQSLPPGALLPAFRAGGVGTWIVHAARCLPCKRPRKRVPWVGACLAFLCLSALLPHDPLPAAATASHRPGRQGLVNCPQCAQKGRGGRRSTGGLSAGITTDVALGCNWPASRWCLDRPAGRPLDR